MTTESKNSFDDVRNLNLSAKDMLAKYGRLALSVNDFEILDPQQRSKAQELSNLLQRDVREYDAEIKQIEKKHEKWPAAPKRGAHFQQALAVGGEYFGVMDNITSTMSGPAVDLTEILNNNNVAASSAA